MEVLIPAKGEACPKEAHGFDRKGGCDNVCKVRYSEDCTECWREYQSARDKGNKDFSTRGPKGNMARKSLDR